VKDLDNISVQRDQQYESKLATSLPVLHLLQKEAWYIRFTI